MLSSEDIDATVTAVSDLDETAPDACEESCDDAAEAAPYLDLAAGPTRLGRYVLLREIGAGAIGVVYAAYHEGLDRKLAIKVLNHQRAGRADLEARLRREAKALAKLSHPNVVQVYDVGEHQGRVFVAMEFVDGETLGAWLQGEHSLAEKLAMFVAAGRGLAAAHRAGVIHRDFKPDNVLVGRDGRPRVLDFGLARATEVLPAARPVQPSKRQGSGPLATLAQLLNTGPSSLVRASRSAASDSSSDSASSSVEPRVLRSVPPPPEPAELGTGEPSLEQTRDAISNPLDHDAQQAITLLSEPGATALPLDDDVVTRDGALLGTPAYMSPEQFMGRRADQASDQFSFCVSLYEALYGQRPFVGKTTIELLLKTQDGEIAEPPANSEVPTWVRQILLRGLSPRPADRFESMDALLAALEHDPTAHRRNRWLTAIGIATVAALAFVVGALGLERAPVCQTVDELAHELWPSTRATQLGEAFARSQLPYARAAWTGTEQQLATWTQAWAEQRVAACEATHVRHEFSAEVLDLRQACLDRARKAFDKLTEQLGSGEATVIERAVEAAAELPDPHRCGDVNALLAGVQAPAESVAAEVEALREQLAEIDTLANIGQWQHGLELAEHALARARETQYGPVLAEALLVHGRLLAESRAGNRALAGLQAALDEAERHAHDQLVPRIATELASLSIYTHPDPIRGRIWARRAMTALDRVQAHGHARARGIWALGNIERLDGEYAQAEAHLQQALALLDEHAPSHPDRAIMLNDLANAIEAQGRFDDARETYQAALTQSLHWFGPAHPRVGHAHYNLARVAFAREHFREAHTQLDAAEQIYTDAYGPQHRDVGKVELLAANLAIAEGQLDDAELHAQRVTNIYDAALPPNHLDRAEPNLVLGHIAFARGQLDQALTHYRSCLATQRAALPPGHIDMAVTLTNLGLVHLSRGESDPAIEQLGEALAVLEAGERVNPEELRMARLYYGDALLTRAGAGDLRRAAMQFEAAFEGCSDAPLCARLALRAARAHARDGDAKAAARWAEQARPLYLAFDPEQHGERSAALAELEQLRQ